MQTKQEPTKANILSLANIRDLLVSTLIVALGWKLVNADFKVDLATFSFNDFLALILALFSVALSVAFYFKASDASNKFYDNTYKFTKEMSEILGRIEAGFGERLRHLDEGYSGMRDKLDRMPAYGATPLEVQQEKEEIRLKEEQQKALLEDLATRAKLAEHEKQALFQQLRKTDQELQTARGELKKMQESRASVRRSPSTGTVFRYLVRQLKEFRSGAEEERPSPSELRSLFAEHRNIIADRAIDDLRDLGMLDSEEELTADAMRLLRRYWEQV